MRTHLNYVFSWVLPVWAAHHDDGIRIAKRDSMTTFHGDYFNNSHPAPAPDGMNMNAYGGGALAGLEDGPAISKCSLPSLAKVEYHTDKPKAIWQDCREIISHVDEAPSGHGYWNIKDVSAGLDSLASYGTCSAGIRASEVSSKKVSAEIGSEDLRTILRGTILLPHGQLLANGTIKCKDTVFTWTIHGK